MPDYKRYGLAGGTLAAVLLTGQVMQMTSNNQRATAAQVQAMPLPVAISDIKLTAADGGTIITAALDDNAGGLQQPVAPEVAECSSTLIATPKAAALVSLELEAACQPSERVVIHHNGMMFSVVTDAEGKLTTVVPALSEQATFIASFAGGDGAVATATVDNLKNYDRAVVQMQGNSGIGLHAREFGAAYDEKGHIWSGAPGDIADGATGHGGFMIELGDSLLESPLVAQIYTFPTGMAKEMGEIALSVDIEITQDNCDQDIEAQTLQTSRGEKIKVQSLDLSMPACDAVGDFLMLKNMVNDMKVAFN